MIFPNSLLKRREGEPASLDISPRSPERISMGYLGDFLSKEMLPGYAQFMREELSDTISPEFAFHELPEVLEEFLMAMTRSPDISQLELFGSTARYLASGMNDDHWDLMRVMHRTTGALKDPDLDITVKGRNGNDHVIQYLTDHLLASPLITVTDQSSEGQRNTWEVTLSGHESFRAYISSGPIPTAPWINNIVITLHDAKTDTRIFHLDISEFPKTPIAATKEKRQGITTDWQDIVRARLYQRRDKIFYLFEHEAMQAIHDQDILQFADPDISMGESEAARILELSLRALRMQLRHPLESINIAQNGTYQLSRFDHLFPNFQSKSLFNLRSRIVRLVRTNRTDIPDGILHMLQDELRICFLDDPYKTIQFLRDSGIGLLIPGLSSLSYEEWQNILRSDELSFELTGTRPTRLEMRDAEYIYAQWRVYHGRSNDSTRLFDGLDRFMQALGHIRPEHAGVLYEDLWKPRANSETVLYTYETAQDMGTTQEMPVQDRLTRHRRIIEMYHAYGDVAQIISDSRSDDDVTRQRATNFLTSLALLYDIVRSFPGLTASELEKIYLSESDVTRRNLSITAIEDFSTMLLQLKLIGAIQMWETRRVSSVHRNIVPVSFYARFEGAQISQGMDIRVATGMKRFQESYRSFICIKQQSGEKKSEIEIQQMIDERVALLARYNITLLETLEALTSIDLDQISARLPPRERDLLVEYTKELRAVLRWYFLDIEKHEYPIPPVYRSFIRSHNRRNWQSIISMIFNNEDGESTHTGR